MRQIRITFCDFFGPTNPEALRAILEQQYETVIDNDSPEFVFYSVFGYRFLEHPDSVRIFFTGENVHPDFNLCDYAFGFDWLEFGDRYQRCPNFVLYDDWQQLLAKQPLDGRRFDEILRRPRFCNFIYSNGSAHPFRDELFWKLNGVKGVASAGAHLNNLGLERDIATLGTGWVADKLEFQRECRFTLAIENSSTPGYTTEKLVHALLADTIPIYWGDPLVGRQFNTKRMINCHDFASTDDVIRRVCEIDGSPDLAKRILGEPLFPGNRVPKDLTREWLMAKISAIVAQGPKGALRRNRYVWGEMYEERLRRHVTPERFGRGAARDAGQLFRLVWAAARNAVGGVRPGKKSTGTDA